MTSAITRAPAGAAHAHGFAKSLKGEAPAEGFEALFAAAAGAQPQPVMPPLIGDASGKGVEPRKTGEGANDDDDRKASPQALLMAASMTFVAHDAQLVDPRKASAPSSATDAPIAKAPVAKAPIASGGLRFENAAVASTPADAAPAPASQRIVPNATFVITQPVAHALITHEGRVAETPVPPTADPPRTVRTPIDSATAASPATPRPDAVGAPVEIHVEAKTVSPAPPSSPSQTAPEQTRSNLSPRALVQAAMVEVVRSRGRMPAPDAANADASDSPQPQATAPNTQPPATATAASIGVAAANTPAQIPPIVEQAVVADAAAVAEPIATPKPPPASRAAADIARQRQFVLAAETSVPTADAPQPTASAFETLIALRKADGTLDTRAEAAPNNGTVSPSAPSGAWFGNLPASSTQTLNATSFAAAPRVFDQAAWSAALAQQVTASAIAATRETTVRINPDGLGPIEVRVRVASEHVDVRFAIEHPVTVNMVREALPDLQRMLAQSGLSLGDAQIAQQNAGGRGQASRGDASGSRMSEDEAALPVSSAVDARPRVRVGLLDDFV